MGKKNVDHIYGSDDDTVSGAACEESGGAWLEY